MSDIKQLWGTALAEIELSVSKPNFTTWFKNTDVLKEEGGIIFLSVPNSFVKEWLFSKYHKTILKSLRNLSENVRGVEYVIVPKGEKRQFTPTNEELKPFTGQELPLKDLYINKEDNLNPKYTFESFVVGKFNELAHAAAQAIIRSPGLAYNPFLIYGNTGLGKTHLIQAIGNKIKMEFPNKKVFYTTSEKFFLDYINSVQANKTNAFKERYRRYDVFIMDDIQYFSGKSGTQEELFHLFNTLYDNNKHIIFSADKHYNQIPDIEPRLKSRFGAGMIVFVEDPDFEAKIAILKSKIKNVPFAPSDETLQFIAREMEGSIRELEGILNTIICQSQLKEREISPHEIKALIKNSDKPKRSVAVEDIIKIVSEFYNIEKTYIYQKIRRKEVVKPRQIIMYLLREDFNISYPAIGQKLGGRDHTTVIHSCEKIKTDLKNDTILAQELDKIRTLI